MRLGVISADAVRQILNMKDAVDIMEHAFLAYSKKQISMPQRINIDMLLGTTITMPAYINNCDTSAIKIVSVFDKNKELGLSTVNAIVNVLDSKSGLPLAIIEGNEITAIRTGAACGLATKLLSRENASVLGLIGAGKQAFYQVMALMGVRKIKEIRIYDKSVDASKKLKKQVEKEYPDLKVMLSKNTAEALCDADIITCVTNSKEQVFNSNEVSKGVHINGIGSFTSQMKEVPFYEIDNIKVYADSRRAVMEEAGEIIYAIRQGILAKEDITEIGDLIEEREKGRTDDFQITFFKSVGLAIQDSTIANYIYKKAIQLEKAQFIEL